MSIAAIQADCKRAMQSLMSMSNDELDSFFNDPERQDVLLADMDQSYLENLEQEKQSILENNNELAEANLTREPDLMEKREKLAETSKEGEDLSKSVEEKHKELRKKTGDMSLETALALLQTAASEMEEESDKTAQKFLDNETDLEDFLEQFLAKRKIMHLRLVKAEKLSKILTRDPLYSNSPNYANTPPMNLNSNYFPGIPTNIASNPAPAAVPYPTGPIGMPMPPMGNYFQNHY